MASRDLATEVDPTDDFPVASSSYYNNPSHITSCSTACHLTLYVCDLVRNRGYTLCDNSVMREGGGWMRYAGWKKEAEVDKIERKEITKFILIPQLLDEGTLGHGQESIKEPC